MPRSKGDAEIMADFSDWKGGSGIEDDAVTCGDMEHSAAVSADWK